MDYFTKNNIILGMIECRAEGNIKWKISGYAET